MWWVSDLLLWLTIRYIYLSIYLSIYIYLLGFPRPNGPFGHPSTLPPSTASTPRSIVVFSGPFDSWRSPLDRGRVSAVVRRSPRPVRAPIATPTLPPSTASPRRSFLDLAGSFDAQVPPSQPWAGFHGRPPLPSVAMSLPVADPLPSTHGFALSRRARF